jgi:hypothetical protein
LEKVIDTFGVKKVKINPQSPKTEFGLENQYGILYGARKNILLEVKKAKINP